MRHVLCPIDFSSTSQRALAHAVAFAERDGATLTLLHVAVNLPGIGLPPPSLDADLRDRLRDELERWRAHVPPSIPLELAFEEAIDVHRAIVGFARARAVDLVVVGSHGRSGVERFLLGSVAEKVMRTAPCPVLIVPPQAPQAAAGGPVPLRHVMCPVDLSEGATAALRMALDLARDAGARLSVVHVIEVPPDLAENAVGDWFDADRLRRDVAAERHTRLTDFVRSVVETSLPSRQRVPGDTSAPPGAAVEVQLRDGVAYREILDAAVDGGVDLIVMGEQGRGAVDRLFFGSNTARVARAAGCPVLIARRA